MVACHLQALAVQGAHAVLVISHLPLVGYLVSELCPQEAPPMFATSAIACVEFDADACEGKLAESGQGLVRLQRWLRHSPGHTW